MSINHQFKTLTGGIMYFDQRTKQRKITNDNFISYFVSYESNKDQYDKISKYSFKW